MICLKEPGLRANIELSLIVPFDTQTTANGNLISTLKIKNQKKIETWSESNAYSSYLYGFVIGQFTVVSEKYNAVSLEYFEPQNENTDQKINLQKKFADTQKIIQFFEIKSGIKFPLSKYTQILVNESEAQEKNGFSVIGKNFIDPILIDPSEDWAIVHELAHQWWGNLLTCKTWDHFWLNEGIVVFMTAAYKQHAWGQAAYQREMDLAQKRYQKAIDAKFDLPLTFAGEYPSLGIKRSIVYSKGALFMDALRSEMGEISFWKGIKDYTIKNQFRSVVTTEFQKSMQANTDKNLEKIFLKWVY